MRQTKNDEMRRMLEQRSRLEERIRRAGGKIPRPHIWADNCIYNNQLLETAELAEEEQRRAQRRRA